MKVIVPVIDNDRGKHSIASGFHNAEYVCIYDPSGETYEWISAKSITRSGPLTQELKNQGIGIVISKSMPLMALGVFTDNGLQVLKAFSNSLDENIELFLKNKLIPITANTSLELSACSGSCKSCNTNCN